MDNRLDFESFLKNIEGVLAVYFQTPPSVKMVYPCIRYERNSAETTFANNKVYRVKIRYHLTVIDRDPDSAIVKKVLQLPQCVFDRHYTSDNLNHDSFFIYY